jgi:hypothetical protein
MQFYSLCKALHKCSLCKVLLLLSSLMQSFPSAIVSYAQLYFCYFLLCIVLLLLLSLMHSFASAIVSSAKISSAIFSYA